MLRGLSVYDYDVLSFNYEDVVIDYVMDNVYLDYAIYISSLPACVYKLQEQFRL